MRTVSITMFGLLCTAFILVTVGTSPAEPIHVDMLNASGVPVTSNPAQIRIDGLQVQYTDPQSGGLVLAGFDVIFEWDPESFVLVPVAIAGCESGQLRVQVGCCVTDVPLRNAVVSVGIQQVMTDGDGIARFYGLPDSPTMVRVEADGYQSEAVKVEVPCNFWKRMAVRMNPASE